MVGWWWEAQSGRLKTYHEFALLSNLNWGPTVLEMPQKVAKSMDYITVIYSQLAFHQPAEPIENHLSTYEHLAPITLNHLAYSMFIWSTVV